MPDARRASGAGGYTFANLASTPDSIVVAIRYFHARGWKRVALLTTTDATGQDADQGVEGAVAAEGGGMEIIEREHFGVADLGVAAQLARIKAANPDVLVAWGNGGPAGTVLHGLRDAGMNLLVLLSAANMTPAFVKQFGDLFTKDDFFAVMPYYAPSQANKPTRAAIDALNDAARAAGVQPDQVFVSTWDPLLLLVSILRRTGTEITPARLREEIATTNGWIGTCGSYDFRAFPQRGLGPATVVMVRWDPGDKALFVPASRQGGAPLPSR